MRGASVKLLVRYRAENKLLIRNFPRVKHIVVGNPGQGNHDAVATTLLLGQRVHHERLTIGGSTIYSSAGCRDDGYILLAVLALKSNGHGR